MQNRPAPPTAPALSVLFPTFGRPERAEALLRRLAAQTLPAERFEVVVVDDGSPDPIALPEGLPFACTLLRQANAGPAAARNLGLEHVRADLVLILNDDAVPANDLLERHLAAHAELGEGVAVLGTFGFTEDALKSPFTRLLEDSALLFAYSLLKDGGTYGWDTFWTCNISLSTRAIRAVGGFDAERFDIALCEDVELGLRLCNRGLRVVYRDECIAEHDHRLEPEGYMARSFQLGRYQYRLGAKFGQAHVLFTPELVTASGEAQPALRAEVLAKRDDAYRALEALRELDEAFMGRPVEAELVRDAKQAVLIHSQFFRLAGLHFELTGEDLRRPGAASAPCVAQASAFPRRATADAGPALSIVVVSCNALCNTQRCIESLVAAADPRFPQELIVIDNGSTDGSVEWLRAQEAVNLIENGANHGAPRARNQGIARSRGAWVAFFDNDVVVPRSWVVRTLEHGLYASDVGAIPMVANRASKRQVVPYDGPDTPAAIEAFANLHYGRNAGASEDTTLFTSLAVVVRRAVIERIGGFDETFSPWGFEDDDYSLRVRLAGWRNVVARDSFVHHAHYATPEKFERHAAWLQTNWDAFIAKWCPERAGAALFDYEGFRVPTPAEVTEAQLVFEIRPDGALPPSWPTSDAPLRTAAIPAPSPSPSAAKPLASAVMAAAPAIATAPVPRTTAPKSTRGAANVVVMGCGRSGTSLATGLLATAGWYVGDDPYEGRPANPKGFFETKEINGINEYLLAPVVTHEAPLGRMQHWLALAPEPLEFHVDAALRARMDRLAAKGPYAYKDPRFCYTLDAWRPSLVGAKYLCVFREPAVTANSILKECADAEYLQNLDVDFDRAIAVWDAMYRQIIDRHASTGEWLFVHFDELLTPEGVARVEAFVGAPVAGDFGEARFKRSRGDAPVPAAVARTYRELCARSGLGDAAPRIAELPAARVHTRVAEPELTVLICTYNRKDTLERCLASFEDQTASGRYEIVVVNDGSTDGTAEMLDARPQSAPTKLVHQPNGGLSAARNAGLRVARGSLVLLCNDDTIAAPDLVERHLAAHAKHGPHHAVLGSFEQPRAALDNALMRVLEHSHLVFAYAGTDPNRIHDWTRFWTCNVSVSLDDVRAVGLFDEDFRHYGCEDADLGYRLEKAFGTRVVYDPTARAEHEHVLTFDDLVRRNRMVAAAFVRLFRKHPELLSHPVWKARALNSVQDHERLVVETYPDRARAEAMARELAQIDVGALERAGAEGAEIANATVVRLGQYLRELNHIWWAEGEAQGLCDFGLGSMRELFSALRRARAEEAALTG